jgi:hypothetical protein
MPRAARSVWFPSVSTGRATIAWMRPRTGVIKILRSTYADFGPTLATEKLRTKHGIDLAKETVRRLQIAVGLWIPRKLRPPKIQQPRLRRACIGELVQIDGCEHYWFEDRAAPCTALVYIDDATSRLMHILFTGTESTKSGALSALLAATLLRPDCGKRSTRSVQRDKLSQWANWVRQPPQIIDETLPVVGGEVEKNASISKPLESRGNASRPRYVDRQSFMLCLLMCATIRPSESAVRRVACSRAVRGSRSIEFVNNPT